MVDEKAEIMTFIELFAGIGGFRYGLESVSSAKGQQRRGDTKPQSMSNNRSKQLLSTQYFTCVYANEIDKYACQIYRKNFGEGELYEGDIRTVRPEDIPKAEMLVGGFPCQAFSIAGKRKGFEDTRGTLFYEIARITRANRYKIILLENVYGLLNHEGGDTFATILGVLDEMGYDVQWQVLNSKNFGVPQNRERVFIIGHLRGEGRRQVFPITQSSQSHLKYSAGVISNREKWIEGEKNLSREFSQGQRIYSDEGISQTLAGNAGGQGGKTGLYEVKAMNEPQYGKFKESNIVQNLTSTGKASQSKVRIDNLHHHRTGEYGNGIHYENTPTLDSGCGRDLAVNCVRRLTPTECERLQGFPDGWTEGVSDTQRYKCLGNAVTTNVIYEIGKRLA